MIVAAIAAVMFSMVSGLVSGSSASPEQASATPDDLEVVPAIKVPDPVVVAAPADPFAGGGAVELPDGFLPGEDYDAMLAVARQVAATYTTFSARNTPEQFVATIPAIELIEDELLDQAEKNWAAVKEAGITVLSTSSSIDAMTLGYDVDDISVTTEITMTQTVTYPDGRQRLVSKAVSVTLVRVDSPVVLDAVAKMEAEPEEEFGEYGWLVVALASA